VRLRVFIVQPGLSVAEVSQEQLELLAVTESYLKQTFAVPLEIVASEKRGCSMSQRVFAYGSNMCSGRFRDYKVSPEGPGRPAALPGHRLQFNKKSTDDLSGKANVTTQEGSEVWGVLYSIPDSDLQKLDKEEGGYQKVRLTVQLANHGSIDAWVYVAKKPSNDPALLPYTWYKRFLIEGAHALPADYIGELERIAAVQDSDAERDRRKRPLRARLNDDECDARSVALRAERGGVGCLLSQA
jgi:hypothetical protein